MRSRRAVDAYKRMLEFYANSEGWFCGMVVFTFASPLLTMSRPFVYLARAIGTSYFFSAMMPW